jgi:hypothetical protein
MLTTFTAGAGSDGAAVAAAEALAAAAGGASGAGGALGGGASLAARGGSPDAAALGAIAVGATVTALSEGGELGAHALATMAKQIPEPVVRQVRRMWGREASPEAMREGKPLHGRGLESCPEMREEITTEARRHGEL